MTKWLNKKRQNRQNAEKTKEQIPGLSDQKVLNGRVIKYRMKVKFLKNESKN